MLCLLKLLLLICVLSRDDHITLAHQPLSRRGLGPSAMAVSNISTPSSLIQAPSSSLASVSKSIVNNHCTIGHIYCSFKNGNNTVGKANATDLGDPCVLWDPSCSGNRTLAIDRFFDRTFQHDLLSNTCFVQAGSVNLGNVSNCDQRNPPGRMSEFQEMKNWMRSQQCVSAATEWAANGTSIEDPSSQEAVLMDPDQYHVASGANPSCCGACEMNVENVDIYYWPEPDVNTSCLSIIGDSVRPLDYGATTTAWSVGTITSTDTYWGCDVKTSTYYNTFLRESVTYSEATRTAAIRTIGSLLVKVSLSDPWSPSPCTESNVMSQGSNGSAGIRDKRATMHARGHTLIIPASLTYNDSLPVTTLVSGSFTL